MLDERHVGADDLPDRNLVTALVRLERSRSQSDRLHHGPGTLPIPCSRSTTTAENHHEPVPCSTAPSFAHACHPNHGTARVIANSRLSSTHPTQVGHSETRVAQSRTDSVGDSDLPSYDYCVWLRYISEAHDQGLPCSPSTVCEIGPGATIGAGLAALVSGADRYIAVDGTWAWDTAKNVAAFDGLVELLRRREPRASSGEFPSRVLTDDRMAHALDRERLRRIRDSIARVNRDHSCIRYIVQKNGDPMSAAEHSAGRDSLGDKARRRHGA